MAEKKPDALKSRELLVVSSNPSRNKEGSGWKMRVVQYYKDGKHVSMKLEVGEYYKRDDGAEGFTRKGLAPKDWNKLKEKDAQGVTVFQKIDAIINSTPTPPADEPSASSEESGEAPPFS